MHSQCKVCRHPKRAAIEDALLKMVPLRLIAQQVSGVSAWSVHRHRQHLPAQLVKAQQAQELCNADSLLSRVEHLLSEVKEIAAHAKAAKDWPAATAAFREMRGCLELLGKVTGELQLQQRGGGDLHLHRHAHIHAGGAMPKTEIEIDLEIAKQVAAATAGFDPQEIARLKMLAAGADPQSFS
jgi:hypothetical protein